MAHRRRSPETAPFRLAGSRPSRSSLADDIEKQLREAIITGELPPGARLTELEIAQQMGTSQAPAREALQRLEHHGLVERHSRSATYVTPISMDEMYEIALVRKVVESIAVEHTARCIRPDQCDELEALVEQMRTAARANDMFTLASHDLEFHRLLLQWSDKPVLQRVWSPLFYQQQRFLVATHPHAFPDLMEVADLHEAIVKVLRRNDPQLAVKAIQEHMMLIWDQHRIDSAILSQEREGG